VDYTREQSSVLNISQVLKGTRSYLARASSDISLLGLLLSYVVRGLFKPKNTCNQCSRVVHKWEKDMLKAEWNNKTLYSRYETYQI